MGYPHKSHPRETPVLSKHFGNPDARKLETWKSLGGYKALQQALAMDPVAIQTPGCVAAAAPVFRRASSGRL